MKRTEKEWFELGIDRYIQKLMILHQSGDGLDFKKLAEIQAGMEQLKKLTMEDFKFIEQMEINR